jgi:putative inorganic carbon (hco3(-)) transporter
MLDTQSIRKCFPVALQGKHEWLVFLALAACISLVLVSIAASQILLALTIVGFVWILKHHKGYIPPGMHILLPLIVFMIWMLVAVFASPNVTLGLKAAKKFYLFLLVPVVPLIVRGPGRLNWIYKAISLVAVISSLKGLIQFAANPDRDLLHRISGFMSQWMTYSGLLMLVLVLLMAYAFHAGLRNHKWVIPVAAIVVLALILTLTRNSWMGATAGIIILILLKRPRAIILLLAAVLVIYGLSPGLVKQRIQSITDTTDPRLHVYMTALHLIQDNPWLGVGPKNVSVEALKYRDEKEFPDWLKRSVAFFSTSSQYQEEEKGFPDWLYQHMHNNFLQIAAETGIPGLLIWLWFMGRLAWDAWRCYRYAKSPSFPGNDAFRKEALIASSAALASWTALMVAGMFEYNFGDSEVLTFFLFLMSAPYAFAAPDSEFPIQRDKDLAENSEPGT